MVLILIIPWVDAIYMEFIFVYGTLRKTIAIGSYDVLARYSDYFADGYLQGKLYEVNGYPAAIESNNPQDKIYGELYKMADSRLVLPALDAYEECTPHDQEPHEYRRKQLTVSLCNGGNVIAWAYIFNHEVTDLTRIKSGDYLHYLDALNTVQV
jgi:gamma-glutamylcyclotransferase (GGCT)/AIG2-like uncharacterized protein YtfP